MPAFPTAYIVAAQRSPIGKLQGALKHLRAEDLVLGVIKQLRHKYPAVPWQSLQHFTLGCSNQAGEDNRNIARRSILLSSLPQKVPATTINSLCLSGIEALQQSIRQLWLGEGELFLAGGVESMSRSPYIIHRYTEERVDSTIGWRFIHPNMSRKIPPLQMSETAEYLAQKLHISRQSQDYYTHYSQQRYQEALQAGIWQAEIAPLPKASGQWLCQDEQPRHLSLKTLERLPALHKGSISLGNTARSGDAAALLLIASEDLVRRYALRPLAKIVDHAQAAVHPSEMSLAAVPAAQKILNRQNWTVNSLSFAELSESFALQSIALQQALGIAPAKVNPQGGALAMGNPVATGAARMLVTAAQRLGRGQGERALVAVSAGLGLGAALLLEAYAH